MEDATARSEKLHDYAQNNGLPVFPETILRNLVLANYSETDYYALTKTYSQSRPGVIGGFNEIKQENEEAAILFLKTIKVLITNKDPHGFLTNIRKTNMVVDIYKHLAYNFVTTHRPRAYNQCFRNKVKAGDDFYIPVIQDDYEEFLKVVKLIGADEERSLAELEEVLSSSEGVWREKGIIAAKAGFDDIAALFT